MNIIFISPPGAGKGTQSELLKEKYNLNHISTGELLREVASNGTDFGNKIAEIINSGNLIDDDLMMQLLGNKIDSIDKKNGIIFDGSPRTEKQAVLLDEILEKRNMKVDYVFYLTIAKEEAMKRALGRVMCSKCGKIYNTYFDKFDIEGRCNECKSKLEKRVDDTEEKFNVRFDSFVTKTQPLIDFYRNRGILHNIECGNKKEETFEKIKIILKN